MISMKKKILVSIIVPMYNNEKYIKECLDTLINQTYNNIEIIIIDDGSKDDSYKVATKIKDKRIKLIKQENKGANAARRKGIELATGDYCLFVDSDDWIDKNTIEELVTLIEDKNYEVIRFNGILEPSNKLKNIYNIKQDKKKLLTKKELYDLLINTKLLNNLCFSIYKTSLLKNNKSFDYDISNCEDYLVNLEVFTNSKKVLLYNKIYYHYRENLNSTTKTINEKIIKRNLEELIFVYSKLFDYLKVWKYNSIENQINVTYQILEMSRACLFNIFKIEKLKKKNFINYASTVFENNVFTYIRENFDYKDINKKIKNKSIKYKIKNSRNIKYIYEKEYKKLYYNYYLYRFREVIKRVLK